MKALTYVHLPAPVDERVAPGDSVSEAKLKRAGQSDEDIKRLIESGALGEDDAPLAKAHAEVAGV